MFYYYIILATRKTVRGNPWLEPVEKRLKPRIERTSGELFRQLLSVFEGDVGTMDRFLS